MTEMIELLEKLEQERFLIDSDGKALWAVNKIREAEKSRDELVTFYQRQIEKAKQETEFRCNRLRAMLEDYAIQMPLRETKTQKSYSLPGCKLIFKKSKAVVLHDDERILKALKEAGKTEYIKMVEKLDWASLKQKFIQDGETVDGISVEIEPERFEVKLEDN